MSFFTPPPPTPVGTDPATFRIRAINAWAWLYGTLLNEFDALHTLFTAALAAMNTNDTRDTSTSSVLIGTGTKVFTVSAGKSFSPGQWLTISNTPAPTNQMIGNVTSYSGTTLTVTVPTNGVFGSGTLAAWTIALTAAPSTQVSAAMTPVASAATLAAAAAAMDVPTNAQAAAINGLRNVVMNGNMAISQEFGTASTSITAGAALKYVVDGWYAACTGANVTAQQVITNNKASLVVTGLAANTGVTLGHRIESADSYSMAGLFATLSLLVSSSTLTTVNWGLYYANTKDAFGTIAVPTRTLIQTGSFTGITSTAALKSAITSAALAAGAHTGLEIVISVPSLLGAQTLTITDVQLEKGSIANPVFENLEYSRQFARCITRRRKIRHHAGVAVTAAVAIFTIRHDGMRAAPTPTQSATMQVTSELANFTQSAVNLIINSNNADGGSYRADNFAGMAFPNPANLTQAAGFILLSADL